MTPRTITDEQMADRLANVAAEETVTIEDRGLAIRDELGQGRIRWRWDGAEGLWVEVL